MLNGWGELSFDLAASIDLYGAASVAGDINGWVDPPSERYAIFRQREPCTGVGGLGCTMGSGVVSSTGVAGCITITSSYQSPDLVITLGSPPTIGFAHDTININAGVGYRWGASWPDIFANWCGPEQLPSPAIRGWRAGRRD